MRTSAEVKHRNMKSRDVGRRKAQQPRRVQEKLCPWKTDVARVSVQGSDVEGKMERNVGSGEERQLSCMRGDFRLLKAKVVLASQLCKAAMSSAR